MYSQIEPHVPDEVIMTEFFLSEGFADEEFYAAVHLIDEAGSEKKFGRCTIFDASKESIMNSDNFLAKSVSESNYASTAVAANRVIRNTYLSLSMTLLFAAFAAALSIAMNIPHPGILLSLAGYFGLLFLTMKLRNSIWGLGSVFLLAGFMGLTLGPIINQYLGMANGAQTVMAAMSMTAIVFISLSAYAISSKKYFSFMGGFLFAGVIVILCVSLAAIFFSMPRLSLAVSAAFVLLMSALILYETGNIINGGETNYIMATVSLFVAILNLFVSFLHLLGFMNSNE